jgi:hypothetical protein
VSVSTSGPLVITNTLGYRVDAPDTGLIQVSSPGLRVQGLMMKFYLPVIRR